MVSGIAGAETNNNIGVAGVSGCWDSSSGTRLMILKDGDQQPDVFLSSQAIEWAADNGAIVINMSTGYSSNSGVLQSAVNYATNLGVTIVASTGNNGGDTSNDKSIRYPAKYSNTIAVGATVEDDTRWIDTNVTWQGSAIGPELDLMAPGGAPIIWTTGLNSSYTLFGGTSASAPYVAGVAGLMKSVNPNLTPSQIRTILQNTADWESHMNSNEYGHGRLNAYEAVKYAMPKSNNHSFTSSQTLSNALFISGSSTIASGAMISVAEGTALIIEGSVNTFGTSSTIHVEGLLDIEESANISNVNIDVGANGMVMIREGASISNGAIEVASGGELVIREGATLSFGSGQGILSDGTISVSGSQASPVVMEASGSSYWDGVHLYGSSGGFHHLRIDGAVNGLSIYNSNNVGISNTEITGSQFHGMHFSSSNNVLMSDLNISQNGSVGIYVDGGDATISHGNIHDNGWEGVYANGGSFVQGPDVMSLEDNVSSSLRLGGSIPLEGLLLDF